MEFSLCTIDPFLRGDLLKLALDALERAGSLNS